MRFIPSRAAVTMMAGFSLAWPDVVDDLERVQTVTPVVGYETRERWCGSLVEAYIEPDDEDEDAVVIVGVRPRRVADPQETRVVGVEARVTGPRVKGKGGSRWPSSWRELLARLQRMDDVEVVTGGKHLLVLRDGQQVAAMPASPSEYRGLMNMCLELRARGIDVRRVA
jgi:hypothetical protein